MSPIDDELRSALSGRAHALSPSPDPLAGIEGRARRIRRNRVAASVAGSVLAVAAVATVVPALQGAGSGPVPRDVASAGPTVEGRDDSLDLARPWPFRGEAVDQGTVDTIAREYAALRGADSARVVPLFAWTYESSGQQEVFFAAEVGGERRWGVSASTEAGPEFRWDQPLAEGARHLAAALPGDETGRVMVVASPEVERLEYGPDGASEYRELAPLADGVGISALDGDPAQDLLRVTFDADAVVEPAPDVPGGSPAPEDEGPGTDTPVEVDDAAYALRLDDPWAYRGPAELQQHPGLAAEDSRLFAAGGSGRGDGWSDRPLYALERADGLSVLMVLHTRGDQAVVTTTWQRQDEAARQSEQPVEDGDLVLQTFLPQSDGTGVLVALAAPRTGAVEVDVRGAEQEVNEQGVGVWTMPLETAPGELFLYSEGDGLLYHSEPARRS